MTTATLYIKAFHIIFVVTWFAGLFYIVRLFIYHTEAMEKDPVKKEILSDQFKIMSKRLWLGITWPSMILTIIFGGLLIYQQPFILEQQWIYWKLGFVIGLIAYHLYNHKLFKLLQNDVAKWTSLQLRLWNELATIFLFVIVFIVVVFRSQFNLTTGIIGGSVLTLLLLGGIMMYKKKRGNQDPNA